MAPDTPYASTADLAQLTTRNGILSSGRGGPITKGNTVLNVFGQGNKTSTEASSDSGSDSSPVSLSAIPYDASDANPNDESYDAYAPKFLDNAYAQLEGVTRFSEPDLKGPAVRMGDLIVCGDDTLWRYSNTVAENAAELKKREAAHVAGAVALKSTMSDDGFGCDCMELEVVGEYVKTTSISGRPIGGSAAVKKGPAEIVITGEKTDYTYGSTVFGRAYDNTNQTCDLDQAWRWSNTVVKDDAIRRRAHTQMQTAQMMHASMDDFGCDEVEFEIYGK
jgi:hypothetical protein